MFSGKFTAYVQTTFLQEHLRRVLVKLQYYEPDARKTTRMQYFLTLVTLSDSSEIRTHNHFVRKRIFKHLSSIVIVSIVVFIIIFIL